MTQNSVSEMTHIRITQVFVKNAQSVWPHPDVGPFTSQNGLTFLAERKFSNHLIQ